MTSSERIVSTLEQCKFQMVHDQVSRGVSVLCWLAALVANVLSMESVTVYHNVPEYHVTFGRGGLHSVL